MPKRTPTKYPGVYYREARRVGGPGVEKVFYITFKQNGRKVEEKVGRQFADNMTPAKANSIRSERIEGKRKSRAEIRQEQEAQRQAEANRWTFSRLWEEYKRQRPMNKALVTDDNRFKLHLAPVFGDKVPEEVLTLDVDRLRVRLLKSKAPQTCKHVLALLKRIILFGVKKGLCAAPDPRRLHIEMPRVDNKCTEDLDAEELERLLGAIDADSNRTAAGVMKLALYTGMRRGEIFNLEWRDLDFERGHILIRNPKGGKSQSIPMNEMARALLEAQPRAGSPYVFPGQGGGRLQNIQPSLHRIRARAGLPKDFRCLHGLRHVYASMLASSGKVDLYTLQKLLTHKSPAMTQRYAHLRDEAMKRAAGVAGDLLNDANNGNASKKVVNLGDFKKA